MPRSWLRHDPNFYSLRPHCCCTKISWVINSHLTGWSLCAAISYLYMYSIWGNPFEKKNKKLYQKIWKIKPKNSCHCQDTTHCVSARIMQAPSGNNSIFHGCKKKFSAAKATKEPKTLISKRLHAPRYRLFWTKL